MRESVGRSSRSGRDSPATTRGPGRWRPTNKSSKLRNDIAQMRVAAGTVVGRVDRRRPARSVLLVLQGIDTAGKGGVTEHVVGAFGPIGVAVHRLQEADRGGARARLPLAHPQAAAAAGRDRRLRPLALRGRARRRGCTTWCRTTEWRARYDAINEFEAELVAGGTTSSSASCTSSYDTQRERLLRPARRPGQALEVQRGRPRRAGALGRLPGGLRRRCSSTATPSARPGTSCRATHKKYRNWAIGELLRETLAELDPQYPQPDLDVAALKARLAPPH